MSIDVNDEILQDFLVEAGEILEQLSEQLVDLEQQPGDYDLLVGWYDPASGRRLPLPDGSDALRLTTITLP